MRLKDKVAIITGAGQGLGREFASTFSQEGATVVIADINFENAQKVADEINSAGGKALAFEADVTSAESTRKMAETTVEAFGKIDILVNNAAICYGLQMTPFTDIEEKDWDAIMAVNVKGIWQCSKAVFPQMMKQKKGKIVNLSSATFDLGLPMMLPYIASKGAVVGITRSLAREIGSLGINVNCIHPGFVMTESSKKLAESSPAGFVEAVDSMQAVKGREQPSDVAGGVVYLASDESDFVTGQSLLIDGGTAMH